MSIIGGIVGGLLSSFGAMTQSVGMFLGLASQQLSATAADIVNTVLAVAGGGMQNITIGLTQPEAADALTTGGGGAGGGIMPTWIDPNTIGT